VKCLREKRRRAAALQDAARGTMIPEVREASWSAPASGAPRKWKLRTDRLVKISRPRRCFRKCCGLGQAALRVEEQKRRGFWPAPLFPSFSGACVTRRNTSRLRAARFGAARRVFFVLYTS
jgi:hypothetical protein